MDLKSTLNPPTDQTLDFNYHPFRVPQYIPKAHYTRPNIVLYKAGIYTALYHTVV